MKHFQSKLDIGVVEIRIVSLQTVKMKIIDNNFNRRTNYKNFFLQLLLCKIAGIIPWTKVNPTLFYLKILELIYFLMSVTQISAFAIILLDMRFVQGNNKQVNVIITKINTVSLSIISVYTVLLIYLRRRTEFYQLLSIFEEVDRIIAKYVDKIHRVDKKLFVENAFFLALLPIIVCIWQMESILGKSRKNLWWLWLEMYLRYRIMFVIFIVRHYILQIGYRYEVIENILAQNMCASKFHTIFPNNIRAGTEKCLKDIFKCLNLQMELVDLVQQIFGRFFILVMYNVMLSFLYILTTGLQYIHAFDVSLCITTIQQLVSGVHMF